jgi:hypothetical protein
VKLNWISDENLYAICKEIVDKTISTKSVSVNFDNIVDPFSALFDVAINNLTYDEWLKSEGIRQRQKTLQNMIGNFHQSVIGKVAGWKNLGTGSVIDLYNADKKVIAELKNKYNTTKGNHKVAIYDDLKNRLSRTEYAGFTGYYVAILMKKPCNAPFTPSDNKSNMRRPVNERIREIDGTQFYALATGSETALKDLYRYLPKVLADLTGTSCDKIEKDQWFKELFNKAVK